MSDLTRKRKLHHLLKNTDALKLRYLIGQNYDAISKLQNLYKVHLNTISNGELSDPLCDSLNRSLTLVRLPLTVIIRVYQVHENQRQRIVHLRPSLYSPVVFRCVMLLLVITIKIAVLDPYIHEQFTAIRARQSVTRVVRETNVTPPTVFKSDRVSGK